MMNDYHSGNDAPDYLQRWLTDSFGREIKEYKVVVLTGARQVGKSTFLRQARPTSSWAYLTLDDFDLLQAADEDPRSLLAGKDHLIIDEVQKAPRLLSAIKQAVDAPGSRKHFILSGSANLLLMHKVSESLAGRAVYRTMNPFTLGETKKRPPNNFLDSLMKNKIKKTSLVLPPKEPLEKLIVRGFMPPAVIQFKKLSSVLGWLEGYVATFLERDLRQLAQIENLADFRRLMGFLALRCGQMLNQSEISREAAIPQPTVHRYINLLETTFLLKKVPVYAANRTKRLIKTPKIYWSDCGLAAYLMGHHEPAALKQTREWGSLFETLVFQHLQAWASLKTPAPYIYYWRTAGGQEVDFVIELGDKLLAIEVKASAEVKYADTENLRLFMADYPKATAGIIVYSGNHLKQMGERIWAVPWHSLV